MMRNTDARIKPCLTDEEEAEKQKQEVQQDEDQMLMLYRKLSPGMYKMIRTMVNQMYLAERDWQQINIKFFCVDWQDLISHRI